MINTTIFRDRDVCVNESLGRIVYSLDNKGKFLNFDAETEVFTEFECKDFTFSPTFCYFDNFFIINRDNKLLGITGTVENNHHEYTKRLIMKQIEPEHCLCFCLCVKDSHANSLRQKNNGDYVIMNYWCKVTIYNEKFEYMFDFSIRLVGKFERMIIDDFDNIYIHNSTPSDDNGIRIYEPDGTIVTDIIPETRASFIALCNNRLYSIKKSGLIAHTDVLFDPPYAMDTE